MSTYNKLTKAVSLIILMILLINSLIYIEARQFKSLFILLFAILLILFIFIAKNNLLLPPNFALAATLFVFLTLFLGEICDFYTKFWIWDLLLHFISGIYLVIIAMFIFKNTLIKSPNTNYLKYIILIIFSAFSFSICIGTLWEIYEFICDYFFKTDMVKGGLEDTLSDIISNTIGAFIPSIIYFIKFLKK
jgi:hypothetical protein